MDCPCKECKGKLKPYRELEKKGRKGLFQCPKCKCFYSLTLVHKGKCLDEIPKLIKKPKTKRKKRKKRKRR